MPKTSQRSHSGGQSYMRSQNRANAMASKVNTANCVDAYKSIHTAAVGSGHQFAEMVPLRVVKTELERTELR